MDTFMDGLKVFINQYGLEIVTTIVTAIVGYIAVAAKSLAQKYINDKTKKDVAKIVVSGIEQCYKALEGPQKLQKALEAASSMLAEKGIKVTEVELRMLLESALSEFNKVFENSGEKGTVEDWAASGEGSSEGTDAESAV